MKRSLLLYLCFSIFWLSGQRDAVHHILHGMDSHQEVSETTKFHGLEIKPEPHASCWIEDFLQHRSHQTHLALDFVSLAEPFVQSQVPFDHYQFVSKKNEKFSKLARGPPAIS